MAAPYPGAVTSRRAIVAGVAGAAILLAGGCGGPAARPQAAASAAKAPTARPDPGPSRRAVPIPGPAQAKPRWSAFSAVVSGPLTPADVSFSWRPGCPVPPSELRAIHLSYAGFDSRAHTGEIIVNVSVVRQVITVFGILYRARFPIMRMEPVDVFGGSDPRSMAADNTSGFNCRPVDAPGPPQWSMHAYGLAIDVNTVQNPYLEPGFPVQPAAGAAYVDRSDIRPGMAYPGGILVSAFSSVGWGWGGAWSGSPDYQHFSVNGH
jgi:D-alanyl-D-alanine carboxypeptidase